MHCGPANMEQSICHLQGFIWHSRAGSGLVDVGDVQ